MSNQQAMSQLLSLWQRYQNGETDVFKRGFAGLCDVFTQIKDLRKWDARDRIEETHALEYWRESLEFDGDSPVPFEIELFFRSDATKRSNSAESIHYEIQSLEGHVIQECASYAARQFGVGSAMGLMKAARLCPQALLLQIGRAHV